jgi:pimeloyl-ACP methyl ester carboxylesterase
MEEFLSEGVGISYLDFEPLTTDRGEPIVLVHGFASTHAVNWLFTQWVKTLTEDGRRVVLLDVRGHGRSAKLYDPEAYSFEAMASDIGRLLDHIGIKRADIMGYSLGGRIAVQYALMQPERVRSLVLGGVGVNLVAANPLPRGLAEAMEAERIEDIDDHGLKIFRGLAESTRSDFKALAACARGARKSFESTDLQKIQAPVLICVGTRDEVAGDPHPLAPLFGKMKIDVKDPETGQDHTIEVDKAQIVDIPGRDHNRAVGDRVFKQATLQFLATRP